MQDLEQLRLLQESGKQIKVLLVLPLYHMYGLFVTMRALAVGSQLVLLSKFEPKPFLASIEKYKVSTSFLFLLVHTPYMSVH